MGVHEGHRKRMLSKFLEAGTDNMHPHEVLEMLLFYAIPRRDTNEIAHELISTFGSLRAVFDAPASEIAKVHGMGEYSATLLKMVPELVRYYFMEDENPVILSSIEEMAEYLMPRFIGRTRETVFLLCMDNKGKVIACVKVGEGSVNSTSVSIRHIVEIAVKFNASSVVLAHNHPGGVALPSREDIETTRNLLDLCRSINIPLIDHIVFSDNDYVSLYQTNILNRY